ncbi:MAG: hypothetical protein JWN85_1416 [Gammaproteobacteria bacterium]|nr:hypothetical protein [Gammaproteobacteria bacterium]
MRCRGKFAQQWLMYGAKEHWMHLGKDLSRSPAVPNRCAISVRRQTVLGTPRHSAGSAIGYRTL